ncbi:MAG: endopeptidase La [Bdellovibrionales bacterium]|nr:endopeptidase La [Bdellovibrionales bacterium]
MSSSEHKSKRQRKADFTDSGSLPLLPIRIAAPLPGLVIPLYLSEQEKAQKALDHALEAGTQILVTLQTGGEEERPSRANLSRIGAIAEPLQTVRLSNGDLQVDLHVLGRAEITAIEQLSPFVRATAKLQVKPSVVELTEGDEALLGEVKEKMTLLAEYDTDIEEHIDTLTELFDPGELADLTCSVLSLKPSEAQRLLEQFDPVKRLGLALEFVNGQLEARALQKRLSGRAETDLNRERHQELLREQLRLIRAELGESFDYEQDLSDLAEQLAQLKMPASAKKEAEKQLRRLRQLHPDTSEAALARTYIDWIMDLPWSKRSKDRLDLKVAREILERDHYGLERSKERILDFLSVRKLKRGTRGPILLFVGPPGVGKTSLGRSIAKALNRKFVRISLGGLRDEAELRGHRRTYVGALPGRIIQGLKSAGAKNPVFVLDEIDKVGNDFRGDPASVLLEVLDPEQNCDFEDHYLNIPFDLSEVMFICTANIVDTIPPALLDRMEIIEINGYTPEEKLHIARQYLLPQELEENGIADLDIRLPDKALFHVINGYTRESGVRELRRAVSTVLRKIARIVAEEAEPPKVVTPKMVQRLLGPVHFVPDRRLKTDEIGVVTGLAWTSVGGETLTIEVSVTKGKGTLSLTGQMGEVMRESAMAALTYVLSSADGLGIDAGFYEQAHVHVHVPQGAIPKDGPSAGAAIATALVSVLAKRPVSKEVAMTGEITLRGSVLPIGGLKEKALAALRAGCSIVLMPRENERELVEFPRYLKEKLTFVAVETIDEILEVALLPRSDQLSLEKRVTVKRPLVRPSRT